LHYQKKEEMKNVLITGANKGIGFEMAKQMAQSGYFVFLGSRDKRKGIDAVKKLNGLGISNVETIEMDVTDINSIRRAKRELEAKVEALDVLINNAGIGGERPQNASGIDLENLRRVFETNFFGVIQTTQQFIGLLMKSGEPRIVNVSSEVGSLTVQSDPAWKQYDNAKLTAYASSKTALNAFTVMMAYEFRDTNLKINSITPGFTATDLNQFKGPQTVEQGARAIIKYATAPEGLTGKFFKEEGEIPW
jgi:NAD(P)-dependent dehydrogenase (short-subunit alcohol dehydrogenase family)